jgi:hypothetical protein
MSPAGFCHEIIAAKPEILLLAVRRSLPEVGGFAPNSASFLSYLVPKSGKRPVYCHKKPQGDNKGSL